MNKIRLLLFLAILAGTVSPHPVNAHPHCYILNSLRFVFNEEGLAGIRMDWAFDQFFAGQILDHCDSGRDGVLQASDRSCIEHNYFANLVEHRYFTFIKVNGQPVDTESIRDYSVSLLDGRLVYQFTIPCPVPSAHADTEVRVAVYDPTFYCALTFPDQLPVMLENEGDLDYGCQVIENRQESYYYGQIHPWEAVLVFCRPPCEESAPVSAAKDDREPKADGSPPDQASTRTETAAVKSDPPVSGAADRSNPVSFNLDRPPRMSFQQWILRHQKILRDRMAVLVRQVKGPDGTRALLVLIGLAFVYGIIHAAGPGHGKAVASSYVLARGPRLKKALVFGNLIALFHGTSAVVLVLVLRLAVTAATGAATAEVDRITRLVSYGSIALMGLVLTIKTILEWKKGPTRNTAAKDEQNVLAMSVLLGLVPCPGVVLVLLFCLSLGIFGVGLLMAFFQTLGMALTISTVTIVVTGGRKGFTSLFSKHERAAFVLEHGLELAASLAVLGLGIFFLHGTIFQF